MSRILSDRVSAIPWFLYNMLKKLWVMLWQKYQVQAVEFKVIRLEK